MRKIKAKWTEQGKVPDLPDGERFPEIGDPNVFGICTGDDEYTIYESEEELPASSRERFHVLRDLPDDLPLWRYLDFPRLYYLASRQSLYFTPACLLREGEPYEFRIPTQLLTQLKQQHDEFAVTTHPNDPTAQRWLREHFDRLDEFGLFTSGISCWHINERENNALWSLYTPNGGVAIKTTLGRLKSSLDCKGRHIYADLVEYIDYYREIYKVHPSAVGFEQYFHKAQFFEYEKEFRLLCSFDRSLNGFNSLWYDANYELTGGRDGEMRASILIDDEEYLKAAAAYPVNLSTLICDVVVGPRLSAWHFDLVLQLLEPLIASDTPVRTSAIHRWGAASTSAGRLG